MSSSPCFWKATHRDVPKRTDEGVDQLPAGAAGADGQGHQSRGITEASGAANEAERAQIDARVARASAGVDDTAITLRRVATERGLKDRLGTFVRAPYRLLASSPVVWKATQSSLLTTHRSTRITPEQHTAFEIQ